MGNAWSGREGGVERLRIEASVVGENGTLKRGLPLIKEGQDQVDEQVGEEKEEVNLKKKKKKKKRKNKNKRNPELHTPDDDQTLRQEQDQVDEDQTLRQEQDQVDEVVEEEEEGMKKRNPELHTPHDNQTGGQEQNRVDDDVEEEEEEMKNKDFDYDNLKHLPNLASHFVALTNAVLKRITDDETSDKIYDEFMQAAKSNLIKDLKSTYQELQYFYSNPSTTMPSWLSNSPPREQFYTQDMDIRLDNRRFKIEQDLIAFLEELGFVRPRVGRTQFIPDLYFVINLQLDVAKVPTRESQKHVKKMLLSL